MSKKKKKHLIFSKTVFPLFLSSAQKLTVSSAVAVLHRGVLRRCDGVRLLLLMMAVVAVLLLLLKVSCHGGGGRGGGRRRRLVRRERR